MTGRGKQQRILLAILCTFLCIILGVLKPVKTSALTNTDSDYNEANGMVFVRLIYTDAVGTEHVLKKSCGFFIGDGDGKEYVLTSRRQVTITGEEQQVYATQFEVEYKDIPQKLSVQATINGNVNVGLNIVYAESSNMDIAVLSPKDSLGDMTNLRLATDKEWMNTSKDVHSLGFQGIASDDITVVKVDGAIQDETEKDQYHYYQHNIPVDVNNAGGPLLNIENEVVGVNVVLSDGGNYAIQIEDVIALLDTLGIQYNEVYPVSLNELQKVIETYDETNFKGYTKESVERCNAAYDKAVQLVDTTSLEIENGTTTKYSQGIVDQTTTELLLSLNSLEVKEVPLKTAIILMIVAGVLFIVAAIAITLLIVRVNILKKALKEAKEATLSPQEVLQMSGRVTPGSTSTPSRNMPINRTLSEVNPGVYGSGPLTNQPQVSGVYPKETSVLNAVSMQDVPPIASGVLQKCPTLIRRKTGELIQVSKTNFVLGKASDQVDFFVGGNSNISRKHACIKKMQNGFFIQDLNSTNGTFVNGTKVNWDRDVKLKTGDIIALGDDEFEFNE